MGFGRLLFLLPCDVEFITSAPKDKEVTTPKHNLIGQCI
jgi:hypothetical protein